MNKDDTPTYNAVVAELNIDPSLIADFSHESFMLRTSHPEWTRLMRELDSVDPKTDASPILQQLAELARTS